jgi:tetratricopeptide (TPR) repeat protein
MTRPSQPSTLERDEIRANLRAMVRAAVRGLLAASRPLPAAVAAVAVLVFGVAAAVRTDGMNAADYMREGRRAYLAGEYNASRICFARVASLHGNNPGALWGLAESYEAMGAPRRAAPVWDRLAPPDAPGFAPGQIRRAKLFLRMRDKGGAVDPRAAVLAELHLRRALETDPHSTEANALLGRLLLGTARPLEAVPLLTLAATEQPELKITLAQAYAASGNSIAAREAANHARDEADRRLKIAPDDFDARLRFTKAAGYLGNHAAAVAVLRTGLGRTGDPRYRAVLAAVYASWAEAESRILSVDAARPLLLLEEGLRIDPNAMPLLDAFGRMLRAGGPQADRARQTLRDSLVRGEGGAGTHFVLGLDAWMNGDPDGGRLHMEQAARLDPNGPTIANNLAGFLASGPDPDLKRALSLVELALDRVPRHPRFLGTRGLILDKLGRWKEALPDLEAAVKAVPDDAELHQALADAYTHLGLADMAAAHEGRARALAQRLSRP